MRSWKPTLMVVLMLALVAVLILPATASGAKNNKAVNWVANGENSNNYFHDFDWQGGHSVLVKEMEDGSLEGHGILVGVKPPENRGPMHTKTLLNHDPFTGVAIDVFRVEGDYKVAEFILDFGADAPFPYFKMILWDGGEPKTADLVMNLLGVPVPPYWIPMGPPMEPFSNVQIHMNE